MFPRGEAEENFEVKGKNSLFPEGPVIECFLVSPNLKIEKILRRNRLLNAGWLRNLPQVKEHDLIKCESKVRVVVSIGS